eukprot:1449200-Rhodomonas_salina.1
MPSPLTPLQVPNRLSPTCHCPVMLLIPLPPLLFSLSHPHLHHGHDNQLHLFQQASPNHP